jgi:hypothetical protein
VRSTTVSLALILAVVSFAPAVLAEAPPSVELQDEQRSRALFDRARKLTEQSLWEEACLLFEQAHALHATGGTALQLANCYEHVGKVDLAITTYKFVIDHADTERVEDRVRIARERIEALERRRAAVRPAEAAPPPSAAPVRDPLRLPAYVALGTGGAGLVVGTLFGVLALSQASDVKSTCTNGVCPRAEESASNAAKTKGWVSTVGFGVGIVGVSVGAALLVLDARRGHPIAWTRGSAFGRHPAIFGGWSRRIAATADGVSFRF